MKDTYSALTQQILKYKRLAAEARRHEVPSKAQVKRAAAPKMTPNSFDLNLKGVPGSNRPWLHTVKAVTAKHTGTQVANEATLGRLQHSSRTANTTQGNYNKVVTL